MSQLSRKTFEAIHELRLKTRDGFKPSGGIQIIGVGDFKQLPTVPSYIDSGEFCFENPLWQAIFKHLVFLTHVYRQDQQQFINVH